MEPQKRKKLSQSDFTLILLNTLPERRYFKVAFSTVVSHQTLSLSGKAKFL